MLLMTLSRVIYGFTLLACFASNEGIITIIIIIIYMMISLFILTNHSTEISKIFFRDFRFDIVSKLQLLHPFARAMFEGVTTRVATNGVLTCQDRPAPQHQAPPRE